jgi:hypothetical protein
MQGECKVIVPPPPFRDPVLLTACCPASNREGGNLVAETSMGKHTARLSIE